MRPSTAVSAPLQPRLPLFDGPRFSADEFRASPSNAEALAWVNRTADWPGGRLALWGEAGCGKTHLLRIWAARAGGSLWHGADLRGLPELPQGGVALDDASAVMDETAMFHLLNAAAEAGLPVLLASRLPPARWPVRLPDLASRLRAITAVEIGPPDDTLLRAVLARVLRDRGIRLPDEVNDWLLSRLPRSAAAVIAAAARLDAASMEHRRTITVPLAREVLAELIATPPDEFSGTDGSLSPGEPSLL